MNLKSDTHWLKVSKAKCVSLLFILRLIVMQVFNLNNFVAFFIKQS